MLDQAVKTPCIGVCSTGIGDTVCRGCKRFEHEVIHWNSYSEAQKRAVDQRVSGFLSQCVSNKIRVTDEALLRWQLEVQQIAFIHHHDQFCWAYSLIKAGASQIKTPKEYGFEVDLAFRGISLLELREKIDTEFFTLSQAHYDRYMRTADLFAATDDS
ncbi:MAG: putative Fe-S protein YdhL (DUF1289 family) [Alcanivorax sp.]|jgi:predicted Fe-S protein YdhL (DUF1289 family)